MYIYKRKQTYWVTYMVDGKRYQVSTRCHKLADAKFFAASIEAAKHAPSLDDAIAILKTLWRERPEPALALADAWPVYERTARAVGKLSISPKTLADRKNHLAAFVKWAATCAATIKTAADVSGPVAVLYAQHLAASGAKTKTRKNTLADLAAVWKMLEKTSPKIRNPWSGLAPQNTDSERGEPFTREQEAAVFAAAKAIGKDWFEICTLARHTGLRYGSCAFLEWSDIHWDSMTIETEPSKTKRFGISVAIPIVKPLADVLKTIPKRGDYLFPIHADTYSQFGGKNIMHFREVLDAAGISGAGYTFHSWRHTFRTRLAESGADIETAMRLCGHTQKTTSRHYDHYKYLDETRELVERAAT